MSLLGEEEAAGRVASSRRDRYSSPFETTLPPTTEGLELSSPSSATFSEAAGAPATTPRPPLQRRVTSSTIPMASPVEEQGPFPSESKRASIGSSTNSRFSFLNRFIGSAATPASGHAASDTEHDDLIQLDIEQTLHALSSPTDGAAFSPAAFKNLQLVATGLLRKFQTAYVARTGELREMRAARDAREEETEEMETKVQHLKMQLEVMAAQAAEQQQATKVLEEELARERRLRAQMAQEKKGARISALSSGSSMSEDLRVEEDQDQLRGCEATKRDSQEYESDRDTVAGASVFSRTRSPTINTMASDLSSADDATTAPSSPSPSSALGASLSTTPKAAQLQAAASIVATTPRRATLSQRSSPSLFSPSSQSQPAAMTTFQRLFKARASVTCQCNGQDSSVAWDTVSLLRDENRSLKERVGTLENAVEGALDAVNLVGM